MKTDPVAGILSQTRNTAPQCVASDDHATPQDGVVIRRRRLELQTAYLKQQSATQQAARSAHMFTFSTMFPLLIPNHRPPSPEEVKSLMLLTY